MRRALHGFVASIPLIAAMTLSACELPKDSDTKEDDDTAEEDSGKAPVGGGGGGAGTNTSVTDDYDNVRAIEARDNLPANGRKILIVVANDGFYFKEYSDPRVELEAAGFEVVVAAGTQPTAVPHPNSGQLDGDGTTTVDLPLASVNPDDYAAIVLAGGWGASSYYYGYAGAVDYAPWNQKPEYAEMVNNLIGAFVAADKYVVGICNGVLVLAWSRVGGDSLLNGKNVAAPDGGAPGQTYLDVHYNDNELVMSTFATDNGANVAAPYSIGDATTATDDVIVDGKVITAQNQYSAQEAGRKLAELLAE